MFNIFKKKEEKSVKSLKAIVSGNAIELKDVPDEIFASKALGDGIAIIPNDNIVVAPCECTVVTMNEAMKHACGLRLDNGLEILIHVGIDTVRLQGEGFKQFVKEGAVVKAGQPLLEFNRDIIKNNNLCDYVMMILTDLGKVKGNYTINYGNVINNENVVIEWR